MSSVAVLPDMLQASVVAALGDKVQHIGLALGEVTVVVRAADYHAAAQILKTHPACQFEQLMDLCGLDYSQYQGAVAPTQASSRFGVVLHLLSLQLNQRLRLKVFALEDDLPALDSVTDVWNAANWFEREAFDLFGIVFEGHTDLRRILTDYGFIGHPFRKDFPLSGHVEMRYDAQTRRVLYQPVTIEPREMTPRIVREDNYAGLR